MGWCIIFGAKFGHGKLLLALLVDSNQEKAMSE